MTEDNSPYNSHMTIIPADSNIPDVYRSNKVKSFKTACFDTGVKKLLANYSYIDKTKEYMWLLSSSPKILLIRPRRFGKSTTLNFLEFICQGVESRQYFKGTYIYDQPWTDFENKYLDKEGDTIEINSEDDKKE